MSPLDPERDETTVEADAEKTPPRPQFGTATPYKRKPKLKQTLAPAKALRQTRNPTYQRFQPIWQRIEGEWKRFTCPKCRGVSFRVLDQEGIFVHVRCVRNHQNQVLAGFQMEKPE